MREPDEIRSCKLWLQLPVKYESVLAVHAKSMFDGAACVTPGEGGCFRRLGHSDMPEGHLMPVCNMSSLCPSVKFNGHVGQESQDQPGVLQPLNTKSKSFSRKGLYLLR